MLNICNQFPAESFTAQVDAALIEDADKFADLKIDMDELRGAYLQIWLAFVTPAGAC